MRKRKTPQGQRRGTACMRCSAPLTLTEAKESCCFQCGAMFCRRCSHAYAFSVEIRGWLDLRAITHRRALHLATVGYVLETRERLLAQLN